MTWSRLPIFVWSVFATSILMVLAAPMLIATLLMAALDRTINTSFFVAGGGGSSYLFENLFWFFGHPEVYILALPGFGIVLELLPVFTRKPLWGYRLAVSGMLGVTLLSFFVWQHHLFVSGINADLRPFYMLSTEIISIPTGFIFLCVMGTLWKARMIVHRADAVLPGVDVQLPDRRHSRGSSCRTSPTDTQLHGSFFVMAHFHYTIMGGLDLRVLRRDLLLGAEDDRPALQREARQMALLADVHLLQLDLPAAVRARHQGHAARASARMNRTCTGSTCGCRSRPSCSASRC